MTSIATLAALAATFSAPTSDPLADLPNSLAPGALTALSSELLIDEPGDGQTWARGPQWKASFGPEGMTFIPFFGSEAPRNYPVNFDLKEVQLSGEALPLMARSRKRAGHTVELDRGSVSEVYHLSKESVEQTFVFDQLPVNGELSLEVDVKTELYGEAHQGGFVFRGDLGEVHYGEAIVVDAEGKSLGLHQELTETGIRIVVPESFISAATFPIVVDPVVSTFTVAANTRRQLDVDVAYDVNNSLYQIVYSEVQSATDFDVITTNYNVSLGLLVSASSIDITSASWDSPRNATNFEEQQFLCVATVGNTIGSTRIWGRTRSAATGARGPQFQISGLGATHPDVGGKGNSAPSSFDYMVVWQEADTLNQDFDIVAQAVEGDSVLTGARIVIDGDSGDLDRHPSISKTSGRPGTSNFDNNYMIVWERELSPTNHDIRGQVIRYTGSSLGAGQFSVYTFSDALAPDVSSVSNDFPSFGDPYWVVAFRRLVAGRYKIFTVVAQDGNADNARNVHTMQNLDVDNDHDSPTIAQTRDGYVIGYQTNLGGAVYGLQTTSASVLRDGTELRIGLYDRRDSLGVSAGLPARIGIASRFDGGDTLSMGQSGDALVAWTARSAGSATGDANVLGALVNDSSTPSTGSQYCEANVNSTGSSAWIQSGGLNSLGANTAALQCTDLPPNSFGHFIVSNQSGFVTNPGGSQGNLCLQGSVGRFNGPNQVMNSGPDGRFALSFGWDSLPSPMGPITGQLGETWYFQCWFRDIGPSSNFSNAIEVFRY